MHMMVKYTKLVLNLLRQDGFAIPEDMLPPGFDRWEKFASVFEAMTEVVSNEDVNPKNCNYQLQISPYMSVQYDTVTLYDKSLQGVALRYGVMDKIYGGRTPPPHMGSNL